ncbi:MAG: hypothetical protein B7Z55_02420 [Planctomycetales bacterium 12-60-4]|nr:MAG: hypothetical protein B7Z55_02420 [Planctomycetales bacterium 12-60-4]
MTLKSVPMHDVLSSAREELMSELEFAIRRDPARRGLLGSDATMLVPGHLSSAADHISRFGQRVWILTGFYVPRGTPPAAETDGPIGAAFLAASLLDCGMKPLLLTDRWCWKAVQTAAAAYRLPPDAVVACPDSESEVRNWSERLFNEQGGPPLTHVISVERVGPAHRPDTWSDAALAGSFRNRVPEGNWNRCHNMRGEIIDEFSPPLYAAIEWVSKHHPGVRTVGIGDGGNEIGMGTIPYSELRKRLVEPQASQIPCRIATDWTILAGVSNWGAMALAAAVCWQRGCLDSLRAADRRTEELRLKSLVEQGPAVDGVTRLQEPTVDGLPFVTYLQPWETIRTRLQLD